MTLGQDIHAVLAAAACIARAHKTDLQDAADADTFDYTVGIDHIGKEHVYAWGQALIDYADAPVIERWRALVEQSNALLERSCAVLKQQVAMIQAWDEHEEGMNLHRRPECPVSMVFSLIPPRMLGAGKFL